MARRNVTRYESASVEADFAYRRNNEKLHMPGKEFAMQLVRLLKDRRAVTALEYGLIASLIAVVIIAAVSALGSNISNVFQSISSSL